jgi:hypothetical protein
MIFEGIEFKEIPNNAGYYTSKCGIILSVRRRYPRILRTDISHSGYIVTVIYDNHSKPRFNQVHRLVYMAWVGPIKKGLVIDHIDGVKTNNNINNLEAVTPKENSKRAFKLGLSKPRGYSWPGESNPNAMLSDKEVINIRELYEMTFTQEVIAGLFNTTQSHVSRLIRRELRSVV